MPIQGGGGGASANPLSRLQGEESGCVFLPHLCSSRDMSRSRKTDEFRDPFYHSTVVRSLFFLPYAGREFLTCLLNSEACVMVLQFAMIGTDAPLGGGVTVGCPILVDYTPHYFFAHAHVVAPPSYQLSGMFQFAHAWITVFYLLSPCDGGMWRIVRSGGADRGGFGSALCTRLRGDRRRVEHRRARPLVPQRACRRK
jgi:hypothetical protein